MKVKDPQVQRASSHSPRSDYDLTVEERHALVARIDARQRERAVSDRELLRDVVAVDRSGAWVGDAHASVVEWLSARYGVSNWDARRWLACGYALEKLPHTAAALAAGLLSLKKTVELTRFATPETEERLIKWARRVSPAAVRRRGDAATKAEPKDAEEAHLSRYLNTDWSADGLSLAFDGRLPQAEGAAFIKRIDRIARQNPQPPAEEDGSKLDAESRRAMQRADALSLLVSADIAADNDPDRATVVVSLPWEALEDQTYGAHIEGGPSLHPAVAERLACDCRLQPIASAPDGNVGIGRVSRNVPHWLRRRVLERDNDMCFFPGCERKSFLQIHHVQFWTRGGPTDLDFLLPVCNFHHPYFHELRWSVIVREGIGPIVFRPSGRVYDPSPPGADEARLELEEEERRRTIERAALYFEDKYDIKSYEFNEFFEECRRELFEVARGLSQL
jgi:hypothetical protein